MADVYDKGNEDVALAKLIGENLNKVKRVMNWTQARMSELTGYTASGIGYYLKGERLPSVSFLKKLCEVDELKQKNLTLTVDKLLSKKFDPERSIKMVEEARNAPTVSKEKANMIGAYLCYFLDQPSISYAGGSHNARPMRYGVMVVFDEYDAITAEQTMRVYASFCGSENFADALNTQKDLAEILHSYTQIKDRNPKLLAYCEQWKANATVYSGQVKFSKRHAYIHIEAPSCEDCALINLYAPYSQGEEGYCGGLGCTASVAMTQGQMPTAQKIIVTKYELRCSQWEIAHHLGMIPVRMDIDAEATTLAEMCQKLYRGDDTITGLLDNGDKISLVGNRLKQLVQKYVEKYVCGVGSVSEDENNRVCSLIRQFRC